MIHSKEYILKKIGNCCLVDMFKNEKRFKSRKRFLRKSLKNVN